MARGRGSRWARALPTVALAEHRSPALERRWLPAIFQGDERTLRRADADLTGLPKTLTASTGPDERRRRAPLSADVLQIGKLDVDAVVRLRGFYGAKRLSLRLQAGGQDQLHGVARAVTAATNVMKWAPELMPAVSDHGILGRGGTAYMVEELVDGRHPTRSPVIRQLLPRIAGQLHRVHEGVGVGNERLSQILSPAFLDRWEELERHEVIGAALASAIAALVKRDDLLEVSLGHGDLVSSNIMLVDDRLILIDWEYAGRIPIAFDLAKMHINAGPAGPATEVLSDGLSHRIGRSRGHYALSEQLALAHAQVLSRHIARQARARRAGREKQQERQNQRRIRAISDLLNLADNA